MADDLEYQRASSDSESRNCRAEVGDAGIARMLLLCGRRVRFWRILGSSCKFWWRICRIDQMIPNANVKGVGSRCGIIADVCTTRVKFLLLSVIAFRFHVMTVLSADHLVKIWQNTLETKPQIGSTMRFLR